MVTLAEVSSDAPQAKHPAASPKPTATSAIFHIVDVMAPPVLRRGGRIKSSSGRYTVQLEKSSVVESFFVCLGPFIKNLFASTRENNYIDVALMMPMLCRIKRSGPHKRGRRPRRFAILVIAALLAGAGSTASVTAAPISITTIEVLRFGTLARTSNLTETVSVSPLGARSMSGGLVPLGGIYSPAEFEILGDPNTGYVISLPRKFRLNNNLEIETFESDPESLGTLDGTGRATIKVGGNLKMKPNSSPGHYQSPFTIQVDYSSGP